jgi:hypothetical protein
MRETRKAILIAVLLVASATLSSCGMKGRRYGQPSDRVIMHPVQLWLVQNGSNCLVITSASYLPVQRNDEIEFYLQGPASGPCQVLEGTSVQTENWVRRDGVKEDPTDNRQDPRGAKKALKVKANARYTSYKYDIVIRNGSTVIARLDPEIEIMH